ncbi:hypothetical protein RIF29_14537 [Crotalaria pallida]|uniref:Uncharacterized protein n=1 Tax=Crotalaria pallida TaxID=3830 RepID=A0AAN9FE07_CROPI
MTTRQRENSGVVSLGLQFELSDFNHEKIKQAMIASEDFGVFFYDSMSCGLASSGCYGGDDSVLQMHVVN